MASNVRKERVIAVSLEELKRQYRLAKQTIAMHYSLRDRYVFRARFAEISLLASSVVFLVTTFAAERVYVTLGLPIDLSRILLGIASAAAFAFSLALLVIDWRGAAARHQDATAQWWKVIAKFRDTQLDDGNWPIEISDELSAAYSDAGRNSIAIPDKKFNVLKSEYQTKVAVSKMLETYPGAPIMLIRILVRFRSSNAVIKGSDQGSEK